MKIERGSMWQLRAPPWSYRWVRAAGEFMVYVSEHPDRGGVWMMRREFLRMHCRAR